MQCLAALLRERTGPPIYFIARCRPARSPRFGGDRREPLETDCGCMNRGGRIVSSCYDGRSKLSDAGYGDCSHNFYQNADSIPDSLKELGLYYRLIQQCEQSASQRQEMTGKIAAVDGRNIKR